MKLLYNDDRTRQVRRGALLDGKGFEAALVQRLEPTSWLAGCPVHVTGVHVTGEHSVQVSKVQRGALLDGKVEEYETVWQDAELGAVDSIARSCKRQHVEDGIWYKGERGSAAGW